MVSPCEARSASIHPFPCMVCLILLQKKLCVTAGVLEVSFACAADEMMPFSNSTVSRFRTALALATSSVIWFMHHFLFQYCIVIFHVFLPLFSTKRPAGAYLLQVYSINYYTISKALLGRTNPLVLTAFLSCRVGGTGMDVRSKARVRCRTPFPFSLHLDNHA
jgi:hypothetical protein